MAQARILLHSMVVAVLPAIAVGAVLVVPSYRVWRASVPLTGLVIRTAPAQHESVYYRYAYGGHQYEYGSQGGAGVGNPPFDALQAGTPLQLWVDPAHPGTALQGDPWPPLRDSLVLVGAVFAAVTFMLTRYRTRAGAYRA